MSDFDRYEEEMGHPRPRRCPFCGDDIPRVVHDTSSDYKQHWSYFVECSNLACEGKGPEAALAYDAVTRWNQRFETRELLPPQPPSS